ncbi:hypothetical protein EDC94DRAFT_527638 [Helicostylum pulchrum]|nr:hypothetical protein EDC94DRAFT_527638 [Helicostylum pulchrum]
MSPYPESRASYSSVHIDSGDDEDIENAETQAIIADMTLDSDEEEMDSDEGMFVEDEEDDDDEDDDNDDQDQEQNNMMSLGYYTSNNNHWSSDDDEDEEEEEFDYTTALPTNDGELEGNLYDSIAAAFMQSLGPMSDMQGGDATHSANTPGIGEEYQLSPFELAHALSALSAETNRQHQQDYLRRPSLPSNAVSAAQRNRGSQDFNTSDALRALSGLVSDELSMVPLESIDEEETEQELKDPSGSGLGSSFPTMALEQQIQDALQDNIDQKRKNSLNEENQHKKRRLSRSNSLDAAAAAAAAAATTVSMDDLVDTSQLYTSLSRSPSPEVEDDPYSRDLSRWQRIPIGAFRLMRSKNKLWLER